MGDPRLQHQKLCFLDWSSFLDWTGLTGLRLDWIGLGLWSNIIFLSKTHKWNYCTGNSNNAGRNEMGEY